jgi:hypothetical protein
MIFEDTVDAEDGRAVSVSQPPHLAVDLTDPIAHPSRSAPNWYSKALLLRQDMSCLLLPP